MVQYAGVSDKKKIEKEMPFEKRLSAKSIYSKLCQTAEKFPDKPAISFQLKSGPSDPSETLTWRELTERVTQAANALRSLGVGEKDVVAYVLPNCTEAIVTFLAGTSAGIVCPISPLLNPEQMANILKEVDAKVVVTLKSFPKTDVAQRVNEALEKAPNVQTLIEIDLKRYLTPPLKWIVGFLRPKTSVHHNAKILEFYSLISEYTSSGLEFTDSETDRIGACFHTGGTTGIPKIAQHSVMGMLYNGWGLLSVIDWDENDSMLCPLPMFHVFAVYPMLMTCVSSGAHIIFPTPQGYRGDGVFENFWKLVEKWKVSFFVMVPTAASALMQVEVNANVSSLRYALCGSAPLPPDLFNRFESATGLQILEGYGMTEATCLISGYPPAGQKKIGSVGIPFPYTDLKIVKMSDDGTVRGECKTDEVGEICVNNPGVLVGKTYTDPKKNENLFAYSTHLKTGDLGRRDKDGYIWITGRAKDLIIRGGHNIDPALIEDALSSHPAVAMAGAVGQPDLRLGEVPCAYVELVSGANTTVEELLSHAVERVDNKLAQPVHIEILEELPKTPVGKIFKPDLRKSAITRVMTESFQSNGVDAVVVEVVEHKEKGLVAIINSSDNTSDETVSSVIGEFIVPWQRGN
ncbi:MAG: acyl-CoA synthetase [Pseudomonadota bacterium]|nr:acyl-CoA synthetase [Pseudomonadota bacterium]